MLLYPDMRVSDQPENETTCYAAPIQTQEWMLLKNRSKVIKETGQSFVIIGDADDSVYFMRNRSEIVDRVCVLLRDQEDPDTCLESAAWIRVRENFPGMIYICPTNNQADKWQTYAAALGAVESSACMVDLEIPSLESEQ